MVFLWSFLPFSPTLWAFRNSQQIFEVQKHHRKGFGLHLHTTENLPSPASGWCWMIASAGTPGMEEQKLTSLNSGYLFSCLPARSGVSKPCGVPRDVSSYLNKRIKGSKKLNVVLEKNLSIVTKRLPSGQSHSVAGTRNLAWGETLPKSELLYLICWKEVSRQENTCQLFFFSRSFFFPILFWRGASTDLSIPLQSDRLPRYHSFLK